MKKETNNSQLTEKERLSHPFHVGGKMCNLKKVMNIN